jgi:hypothetical protein
MRSLILYLIIAPSSLAFFLGMVANLSKQLAVKGLPQPLPEPTTVDATPPTA